MALIEVSGLTVRHGDRLVLDAIDLSIAAGERLAIIGDNGSGKTTLAHWLAGWLPEPREPGVSAVRIRGRPWREWPAGEAVALAQYVGQVPSQHLSGRGFTVRDEVAFGPENLLLPRPEIAARVERSLALTHLAHLAQRDPFTLSGGEQQRLILAAALAMKPAILILDEPTTNLDPEMHEAVLSVVRSLPESVTVILFDTSVELARRLGGRVLHLRGARLHQTPGRQVHAVRRIHAGGPSIPRTAQSAAAPMLVDDVSFTYAPNEPLLRHLTFTAEPGDAIAIVGPNGAGKSTLLRLVNGLLRPQSGRILVAGDDTRYRRVDELARYVGTVFQVPEQQIFEPTVAREVAFGPRQLKLPSAEVKERVAEALARTRLADKADRHPLDLDHASRRFVAIASVLASRPHILLLDEAQRGLDDLHVSRLETIIAEERARGAAVLLVCHDVEFVARNATAVLEIERGGAKYHRLPSGAKTADCVSAAGG